MAELLSLECVNFLLLVGVFCGSLIRGELSQAGGNEGRSSWMWQFMLCSSLVSYPHVLVIRNRQLIPFVMYMVPNYIFYFLYETMNSGSHGCLVLLSILLVFCFYFGFAFWRLVVVAALLFVCCEFGCLHFDSNLQVGHDFCYFVVYGHLVDKLV